MLHSPSNQRAVKLWLEQTTLPSFVLGRLVRLSVLPICVEFPSLLNGAIYLMAPLARPSLSPLNAKYRSSPRIRANRKRKLGISNYASHILPGCDTVLRFSLTVLYSFLKGSAPSVCFMSEPRNDYGSNAKWSARYYENVARY